MEEGRGKRRRQKGGHSFQRRGKAEARMEGRVKIKQLRVGLAGIEEPAYHKEKKRKKWELYRLG